MKKKMNGFLAKDQIGLHLFLYNKPELKNNLFACAKGIPPEKDIIISSAYIPISNKTFKNVTFENSPQKVIVTIEEV